jgi:glycosyltransferase involved in cell wall biosynthesis
MMNYTGTPLVSILMTSYNREKYIAEAIKSVLASTYQNWELIICDDCSTDKTVEIAKTFLPTDKRIRLYVNDQNLKQFQNRNKAASLAKGKYIKYVDSDDMIYPPALEVMINIMEANPASGMGFCCPDRIKLHPIPYQYSPAEVYHEHYFINGLLLMGPIATIMKTEAFHTVGGFELFGMPSDNHLSLKIAAKYPVVSMPDGLVFWRLHGEQAFSGRSDYENIFNNYNWNLDVLHAKICPLNMRLREQAIANQKKIMTTNILNSIIQKPSSFKLLHQLLLKNKMNWGTVLKSLKYFGWQNKLAN